MPTSGLDTTGLETVVTNIGTLAGSVKTKVTAAIDELKTIKGENATEQARIDALKTALEGAQSDLAAAEAYTGDVVNPDTPPVDPNAPIPDAPVIPSGRRRG